MKKTLFALLLALCCTIPTMAQDATEPLRGDVNYDGDVTPADISALINYLLNGVWPDEPGPDEPITEPQIFTVNGVSFTMLPVEGGTFTMGGTAEQGADAGNSEKPAHEVTVSSFALGETLVTQELWVAVMGSNPSANTANLQNPVETIDWSDVQAFIDALYELTGTRFRVPTEAEWEFAARGGNLSHGYKYAGSNNLAEVAWYQDNAGMLTRPVRTKTPNELGLYDMSGNVFEWCADWYGAYTADAQTDPTGPETGAFYVCRGGSYNQAAAMCRVSYRYVSRPTNKNGYIGLRLAL